MHHKFPAASAFIRALNDGMSPAQASILSSAIESLANPPAHVVAHNRAVRLIERRANLDYELAKLQAEGNDRPTLVSQI